jgi:hypothetical protein
MKSLFFCLFFAFLSASHLNASMIHLKNPTEKEWKEENLIPFDELILSWNANRPIIGKFHFYISVKTNEWSPWLLYATWGSDGQSSFSNAEYPVKVYQDTLEIADGQKATAFQIRVVAEENASLNDIHGLHAYTNGDRGQEPQKFDSCLPSVSLNVPGISQMLIDHPRHKDLCSPTSTTAVTRFLSNNYEINPIDFAQNAWDSGFDIFGNWVFNVAQASTHLGLEWSCWVERLSGFEDIYRYLVQGSPVIVSVRGPLPGSALPYSKGHLMAVIGYDSLYQKVICMDPAFPTESETHVFYDLADFLNAWNRRGNVAYVFSKKIVI